ncbi:hypothetical protein Tco_1067492 [Tanacetum coccineum]|uniref:Uncharacterized protein n=1 Tax=Tanacetum coccineum TaxID=301880 RepID=A0ABQ5HD14_9ASTR
MGVRHGSGKQSPKMKVIINTSPSFFRILSWKIAQSYIVGRGQETIAHWFPRVFEHLVYEEALSRHAGDLSGVDPHSNSSHSQCITLHPKKNVPIRGYNMLVSTSGEMMLDLSLCKKESASSKRRKSLSQMGVKVGEVRLRNLPLIHLESEKLELDRRELDKQEVKQPEVDRFDLDDTGLVHWSLIEVPPVLVVTILMFP